MRKLILAALMIVTSGCGQAQENCWEPLIDAFFAFDREFKDSDWAVGSTWDEQGVEIAREHLRSKLRDCPANTKFRATDSEIPGRAIKAMNLIDLAIISNDPELTHSLFTRFEFEYAHGHEPVGIMEKNGLLFMAAYFQADEAAGALLQLGFAPNMQDEHDGATPLFIAGGQGESGLRLIRNLVRAGADVNFTVRGLTPIEMARERGDLDAAQCLYALGAHIPEAAEPARGKSSFREDHPDLVSQVDEFLLAHTKEVPKRILGVCSLNDR